MGFGGGETGQKVSMKVLFDRMYESKVFFYLFGVLIFLSLFLRDFWTIAFSSKRSDFYCDILLLIIFGCFSLESILNSILYSKYRFSFVFALDTVSTFTLLLDVSLFDNNRRVVENESAFVVRILRLLTIFKIWRATRLYFRKNQIVVYNPITSDNLDQLIQDYAKKNLPKTDIKVDQVIYYSEGSVEELIPVETVDPRKKKIVNKKTIKYVTELEKNNLANNEMGPEELPFKRPQNMQVSIIEAGNVPHRLSLVMNGERKPMSSVKLGESVHGEKNEDEGINMFTSEIHEGRLSKVKEHCRDARRYLAKTFVGFNVMSKTVANYRMKQAGNISKTLMYTNVRNLACFLLLSNFGLSLFLSSIFIDNPKYCIIDSDIIRLLIQEGSTEDFPDLTDSFVSKYRGSDTGLVNIDIEGYYRRVQEESYNTRRSEELIVCDSKVRDASSGREISVSIWLDNRPYSTLSSVMSILRNLVIILILVFNIIGVNRDTRSLILIPMDSLFKYVVSL